MSLLLHPEKDIEIDHSKLHRDISVVAKSIWVLVAVGFLAGVWATTLAADVAVNTAELEKKATREQLLSVAQTLARIEAKIDTQATEQKVVSDTVIRLETKVEALEKEAN